MKSHDLISFLFRICLVGIVLCKKPLDPLQSAEKKYNLASRYLQNGEPEKSITLFKEVLQEIESQKNQYLEAEIWMALGYAYRGIDWGESIDCFQRVLDLESPHKKQPGIYSMLGNAFSKMGNIPNAIDAWHKSLEIEPNDLETRYYYAHGLEKVDRLKEAQQAYRDTLDLLIEWNIEIDFQTYNGHLLWNLIYHSLGRVLEKQGQVSEARQLYTEATHRGMWPHPLQRYTLPRDIELAEPSIPWFEPNVSGYPVEIESRLLEIFPAIRDEALSIFQQRKDQLVLDPEYLHDRGTWYIFRFIERQDHGDEMVWLEENCQLAPVTCSFLKSLDDLTGCVPSGNCDAFFSLLRPDGPTNLRQRIHLPLQVPEDISECSLRVGDQSKNWEIGKILVFDDSFEHEVNHSGTEEERIVLLFDVWHPLVPREFKDLFKKK